MAPMFTISSTLMSLYVIYKQKTGSLSLTCIKHANIYLAVTYVMHNRYMNIVSHNVAKKTDCHEINYDVATS